ncbi:hypothetical protein AArcCO_4029 (plasmid) [Halalkaliarchaeum sp. AArc-CO]|nr:hypothetical protein AArcCO_4029 [Halalkaliarchaeum sp. AArc-CO]
MTASGSEIGWAVVNITTQERRITIRTGVQPRVLDPLGAPLVGPGRTPVWTGQQVSRCASGIVRIVPIVGCLPRNTLDVAHTGVGIVRSLRDIIADRGRPTLVTAVLPGVFDPFGSLDVPALGSVVSLDGDTATALLP